jgi:hypothetical protein
VRLSNNKEGLPEWSFRKERDTSFPGAGSERSEDDARSTMTLVAVLDSIVLFPLARLVLANTVSRSVCT